MSRRRRSLHNRRGSSRPRATLSLIDEALNRSLRTSTTFGYKDLNARRIALICYLIHVRLFDAIPNWDLFENVRKP